MKHKNIIVTGVSRGIGFELVRYFGSAGHRVLALTRNKEKAQELEQSGERVSVFQADITKEADLQKISEYVSDHFKTVDVLVHNAGVLVHKPLSETTTDDFLKVYSVNVFAVAALTRVLLPFLTKGSHVVGISSVGGVQGSVKFPGLSAYSSSKGAVITLMELLAEEYRERGIVFNALALGAVQTEMLAQAFPGYQAPVTAREMAGFIGDFSLKSGQFINGKVINVSNSTP